MAAERQKLGFCECVLDKFQFLKDVYSFECTSKDDYCVCYDSRNARVGIYHERISYELYLVVSLKRDNALLHSVQLRDVLESAGVHDQRLRLLQASSRESVKNAVGTLALLTRKYAHDVLVGNEPTFRALETFKQERTERLRKANMMDVIEKKARTAWRAKNYAEVISLYAPVEDGLDELQARRLEFARSKAREVSET